jgi:Ala-tRNA(Pro) deacylase
MRMATVADRRFSGRTTGAVSAAAVFAGNRAWYRACDHESEQTGERMPGIPTIHEFLRDAHAPYSVVPHRPAYTAPDEALAAYVHGRHWAKVVVCFIDDQPIEAVVSAPTSVNLARLLDLSGGNAIRLADEEELRGLYPDCEVGAMPPFGPLYGQTVYVDAALALESQIVFNAGTHRDAIAMRWNDFVKMVNPVVGRFAE